MATKRVAKKSVRGIVTNILNESGTVSGMNFGTTTLGTATGDVAGTFPRRVTARRGEDQQCRSNG